MASVVENPMSHERILALGAIDDPEVDLSHIFRAESFAVPVRVTKSPEDRWEDGDCHDRRSEELYEFLTTYDWLHNDGAMNWKAGGDGDNGEELMFLLDEYFASRDRQWIGDNL